ncbi:TauD/TfdA dioxygenase family protein [Marinimicrococcus flavescens]|uniref:TauD/TfdA family dioxygenase n=1 Tax=Marinimicrococcus flavescens TaxID=3031815 RepID=A0AAP3XSH3_9PROT|nr:TauD/TfdA family dioxygenase [Marinimicrococcus flavescens]
MALEVRPMWEGSFGAEISGFDMTRETGQEDWRRLVGASHTHGVIRLRGQKADPAALLRLASRFGTPVPHILTHFHVEGHSAVLKLSNIVTDGKQWGIYDGANYWHTDMAFEDPPGAATIVYALKTPRQGGATRVADMYAAYDELPDAMKKRIDGLVVLHHYGNRDDLDENSTGSASKLTDEQKKQVRNVFHRLVRPHPVAGRKALYGVSGSSFGIVGMPDDEAIDLLNELKAHATQERYVRELEYGPGDIAVWDTSCTLHAATPLAPVDSPDDPMARLLHRVSVKGRSPLFS